MPLILDATPGGPTANAYVALAPFRAYAEASGVDVSALTDAQLTPTLVQGTRRLDLEVYAGIPSDPAQALQWPRTGALDPDRSVVLTLPPPVPPDVFGEVFGGDGFGGAVTPPVPSYPSFAPDAIPRRVVIATCELGLALLAGADLRAVDDTRNLKSEAVDVLKTEYVAVREPTDALTRFPAVWRAIAPLVVSDPGDAARQLLAASGAIPTPRPALDPVRYGTVRGVRGSAAGAGYGGRGLGGGGW